MANLPKKPHLGLGEIPTDRLLSRKINQRHEHAHKTSCSRRCESPEGWWPEQRHLDQVLPADRTCLANMDCDKYSYQIFMRPGVRGTEIAKANRTRTSSKSAYIVKRTSLDRPYSYDSPDYQGHSGDKQRVRVQKGTERDYTSNNNVRATMQPTTPVNPFSARNDLNPTRDHSNTTCVSSATDSTSSSSDVSSTCSFTRHKGVDVNHNSRGEDFDMNQNSCQSHGHQEEVARDIIIDNLDGYNVLTRPSHSHCHDLTNNNRPFAPRAPFECKSGAWTHHANRKTLMPQARDTTCCNAFLPQLGLPSEIRDPHLAPAHFMQLDNAPPENNSSRGRCQLKNLKDITTSTSNHTCNKIVEPHPNIPTCKPTPINGSTGTYKIIGGRPTTTASTCKFQPGHGKYKIIEVPVAPTPTNDMTSNCKFKPGYGTYKIIGGRQYKEPPQQDPCDNMKLPPDLSLYKEYQKRNSCMRLGRYDRANPTNEMILPSNKNSTLMSSSHSPFKYMRNPEPRRTTRPTPSPNA